MSFQNPYINKKNGSFGGGATTDRVAVLVAGIGSEPAGLEMNKKYELLQIGDLETLGFSEADTANGLLTHYHFSECFRLSPETSVCLIAVPAATKASDLKNLDNFISALRSIDNVNTIALAGLAQDTNLQTAVAGLQILVDNLANDKIYIDAVLLEGVGGYLKENLTENEDLREMAGPNVSVIIGQDPAIASANATNANYAAIGSALGMLLVRAVHENLGSVDIEVKPRARKSEQDYTLTDVKLTRFLSSSLSNGKSFNELSGPDEKKLNELGYVYIGKFEGYGGYFFSNSHTCDNAESDYCFIERNAIWNKAARIIRRTLIPRVRSKVESDSETGYIKSTTISDWDRRVRNALKIMETEGNCAGFNLYIDPKQAAVSTKPFVIEVSIDANGVVHEFEIDLGFTNKN